MSRKSKIIMKFTREVKEVLDGEKTECSSNLLYPAELSDIIENLTGERLQIYERDENGWQWDWSIYIEYNGNKYVASGSGWYGGVHFCVREDC